MRVVLFVVLVCVSRCHAHPDCAPIPVLGLQNFHAPCPGPLCLKRCVSEDGAVAAPIGVVSSCPPPRDRVRSYRRHLGRALLPPVPWVPCCHYHAGSVCLCCLAPWAPRSAAACPDASFVFCVGCKPTKHARRICNLSDLFVSLFPFLPHSSLVDHLHTLCFSTERVPAEAEATVRGVLYADALW